MSGQGPCGPALRVETMSAMRWFAAATEGGAPKAATVAGAAPSGSGGHFTQAEIVHGALPCGRYVVVATLVR